MVSRFVLAALLAAPVIAVACGNSGDADEGTASNPSIPTPANCSLDATLACDTGSTGYACVSGSNPEDTDNDAVCSTAVTANGQDQYCCFTDTSNSESSCQSDDTLACPTGTFGYSCATGDNPSYYDSTLTCGTGSGGDESDGGSGAAAFCCAPAGTVFGADGGDGGSVDDDVGCTTDFDLTCAGNASGYSCSAGLDPTVVDPTLACTPPTSIGQGVNTFCCFSGFPDASASTCTPDEDVTLGCVNGTYGFSCAAGAPSPDKQSGGALATCTAVPLVGDAATPVADAEAADGGMESADGGRDDYCCVY